MVLPLEIIFVEVIVVRFVSSYNGGRMRSIINRATLSLVLGAAALLPADRLCGAEPGGELLSTAAAYTIRSYGWCGVGQILDGTNYEVPKTERVQKASGRYVENYLVQETDTSGNHLIDHGTGQTNAIRTWKWSSMPKKVEVIFDLGQRCHIERVLAVTLGNNYGERKHGMHTDSLTLFVSDNPPAHEEEDWGFSKGEGPGWTQGTELKNRSLQAALSERPSAYTFDTGSIGESARYVKLVFWAYVSQAIVIEEVRIFGTRPDPRRVPARAGLQRIDERPAAADLARLPGLGSDSVRLTRNGEADGAGAPGITYEIRSVQGGRADTVAADSDPSGENLVDGDHAAAVVAHDRNRGYVRKTVTLILDLKQVCDIERVIVWSAGHRELGAIENFGSFINSYRVAASRVGEPGTWSVAAPKVLNPFWPREFPPAGADEAAAYPIITPPLGIEGRFVRLDLLQHGHSGKSIEVGEVEVWGRPKTAPAGAVVAAPVFDPDAQLDKRTEPPGQMRPVYEHYRKEKFRFGYGASEVFYQDRENAVKVGEDPVPTGPLDPDGYAFNVIRAMSEAGMNGVMPKLFSVNATDPARQRYRIQLLAEGCRRFGMVLFPVMNFGTDHCPEYRRYCDGAVPAARRTACPRDEHYWNEVVRDRLLITAELSLTLPILGQITDFEMYLSDTSRYPGPCLCDACFAGFTREFLPSRSVRDVPLEMRQAWLELNDAEAVYAQYMEREIEGIVTRVEQAVHAVNPDFILGYFPHFERLPGLTRGLGTPEQPVIVFDEKTYRTGMSPHIENVQRRIRDGGFPALYCPGLFVTTHRLPTVRDQLYETASVSEGFWIYCMEPFWGAPMEGAYAFDPGTTRDDYWQAIREAGAALASDRIVIAPEPLGEPRPVYARYREEKFRFGYAASEIFTYDKTNAVRVGEGPVPSGPLDPDDYAFNMIRRMSAAGMNGIMPKLFHTNATNPPRLRYRLQLLAEGCRRFGINLFPVTNFGSDHCPEYRRFCNGAGPPAKQTACPRDRHYWEQVVLNRVLVSVELSRTLPVLGHIVDFEMYGSDTSRYPGPCLCNVCFADFAREFVRALVVENVPAAERMAWLKTRSLLPVYGRYIEREIQDIVTGIEQAVHAANPDFMLGYFPHFERFPGLTRGLGTPTQPVICFSEAEYLSGFSPALPERIAAAAGGDYPALYCPAIFYTQHRLPMIPGHLYRMASVSSGYWLYCMEILWGSEPMEGPYAWDPGTTGEDYWEALRSVNDAIAARRSRGETYEPPFALPTKVGRTERRARVRRVAAPPRLDGRLDDPCWKAVQALRLRNNLTREPYEPPTTVRLAYDAEYLYVAAQCDEPHMDGLKAATTEPGSFDVFLDDAFELFLDTNHDRVSYFHVGINPNGVAAEQHAFAQGQFDRSWRSGLKAAPRRRSDGWDLEIALPLRSLGIRSDQAGHVWGANLNRERLAAGTPSDGVLAAWSPTFGGFHEPMGFGELVFQER